MPVIAPFISLKIDHLSTELFPLDEWW